MNETTDEMGATSAPPDETGQPQTAAAGHQVNRERLDNLDQLRRSRTDKHIAGVAGGLGRYFNIDPNVIRVVLAVLAFFGGAGLLVYGAVWLLVPEEGEETAPVHVAREPRRILLLTAVGVAFLLALGDSFSGFSFGWPLATIAILVAIYLVYRDRKGDSAMSTTTPAAPVTTTETGAAAPTPQAGSSDDGGRRSVIPPYTPPAKRPRKTGIVWFWPTLALIALACGILGVYDADHHVADGAYPALALAVSGLMLLVGSVVGRPGGLILVGALAALSLTATTVVGGSFGADARTVRETPQTAAQVQSEYSGSVGQIVLDLTEVSDPENLAGRSIDLTLRTGEIRVIVPRSINVDVEAELDFAGGIEVDGDDGGGFNYAVDRFLPASPSSDAAALDIDIEQKFGHIAVERK